VGLFAFYSSVAGAITTAPELMTLPIDDHAIVRGHAVFDTCTLACGRMYRLTIHLQRFLQSARAARIPLPYGDDDEANVRQMTNLIRQTCAASGKRDADVRFWLTAGTGNLGVTPKGCTTRLYVLVFGGLPGLQASDGTEGFAEVTVPASVVPHKPALLAELKSNNYLLNALTAMAAQDGGGHFGIGLSDAGLVTESCVLNVCMVGADGVLRTPPFEGILRGTTARRGFELAERHLVISSNLTDGPDRLLQGVAQGPLTAQALYEARELFLVAGDTHTHPITRLDGHSIGDGKVGPVCRALTALLAEDAATDSADQHHAV
jgi:branched-subunit amino acid aminotransferase/4-amino-4-deoxychorismate lyase